MPHDVEVKTGDAAQAASPDSSSPDPHDVLRSARRASATAWLLFLLIIVIALANYVLSRRFGTLHKVRRHR